MRGPYHPPKKRRMGQFSPNPSFFGIFLFFNSNFQNCIPESGFAQGSFYVRPLAKSLPCPKFGGKNRFSILIFLGFTTFSGVLLQFRQNSDKNSDTNSDKTQTKFRQQTSDKIQTTFRQQNSDTNSDRNSGKNSDKCLNQTTKFRQKFRQLLEQNSDKIQAKIQTKFRLQNSDKNSDKFQTKLQTKLQTKFRQQTSDKIQTNKFRQNSDNKI